MTPEQRHDLVAILSKIADSDDATALAAARQAQTVAAACGGWDAVLAETADAAAPDADNQAPAAPGQDALSDSETRTARKLIAAMLAARHTGAMTREELQGYRQDLEEGALDKADLAYLKKLQARLRPVSGLT